LKILKDRYDELFITVIYLLQEGLLTHTEIREFIEILESAHTFASSAILKAIQKSDMAHDIKIQLEKELKQSLKQNSNMKQKHSC
jgi:ABC-type bacteriocin/lantibiotic exporter with double-glycine peptidase domain